MQRHKTNAALRVLIVDPLGHTLPYDSALCEALSQLGHEVHLVAPVDGKPPREFATTDLRMPNVLAEPKWYSVHWRIARAVMQLRYLLSVKSLVAKVLEAEPDVVHLQWSPVPLADLLALTLIRRKAPVVMTVHDSTLLNGDPTTFGERAGWIRLLNTADGIVVHTESAKQSLGDKLKPSARISVLQHAALTAGQASGPIDMGGERTGTSSKIRLLCFGRIKPYKGIDVLIRAIQRLPAEIRSACEVVIAGKPSSDLTPINELLAQNPPGTNIALEDRFFEDAEMLALMASADVFVFPYRQIDTSGVFMLSLQFARPIIASNIGSFSELLVTGRHGYLVNPGDVEGLADAIGAVVAGPDASERRREMQANVAALNASLPSWGDTAAHAADFYRATVASWHERTPVK